MPNEPLIFTCNSETDGFREGDGDLMDKLTLGLNRQGAKAIRIVIYKQDVPDDKKDALEKGELICLEEKRLPLNLRKTYDIKNYQRQFWKIIQAKIIEAKDRPIILYIGSRLDHGTKLFKFKVGNNDWGVLESKKLTDHFFSFFDEINLKKMKSVSKNWHLLVREKLGLTNSTDENGYEYENLVLKQSGALFDEEFIGFLKSKGVKIVICCLEYKFFFRSKKTLRVAFEMLKQQLFIADAIHFLAKKDPEYFALTLRNLQSNSILADSILDLISRDNINFASESERNDTEKALKLTEEEKAIVDFDKTNFKEAIKNPDWINAQQKKMHYFPGIYTVDPFNLGSSISLEILANRKRNILQFGMIRAQKGIDESLELAKMLKSIGYEKLFIIGRVREMAILRHLIMRCFECSQSKTAFVKGNINFDLYVFAWSAQELENNIFNWKAENRDEKSKKYFALIESEKNWLLIFGDERPRINLEKSTNNKLSNLLDFIQGKTKEDLEKNKMAIIMRICGALDINRFFEKKVEGKKDFFFDAVEHAYSKIGLTLKGKKKLADIEWEIKEHSGTEGFNNFADWVLAYCNANLKKRHNNVEVYFNLPEAELREIALECRYALKLDHKGMAENASSIVSCLGLFLPVFTTIGYLTDEDFIKGGKYEHTLILPEKAAYYSSSR